MHPLRPAAILFLAGSAAAQSFQGLGSLPGASWSGSNGVSADGSTVVGYSGQTGFRWTAALGMQDLGATGAFTSSNAIGASQDGSVVVGSLEGPTSAHAFRWTTGGGMQDLGVLPGG